MEQFERAVSHALDDLPDEFLDVLENVAIIVEDEPTAAHLGGGDPPLGDELLGLYVGTPLTERSVSEFYLPTQVFVFRKPILRICQSIGEVRREIRDTVIHELGHHMGLSDEEMPY